MWRGLLGASAVGKDLKSPGRQEYYAANVKSSVYVMMGTREKQGRWDCKKKTSAGWWGLKSNILLWLCCFRVEGELWCRDLRICSARGRSQELNPTNPKAEP